MCVHSALGDVRLPCREGIRRRVDVTLGVRPDEMTVAAAGACMKPGASGVVLERSFLGNIVELRVRLADDISALAEAKLTAGQYSPGEQVELGCRTSSIKVFTE